MAKEDPLANLIPGQGLRGRPSLSISPGEHELGAGQNSSLPHSDLNRWAIFVAFVCFCEEGHSLLAPGMFIRLTEANQGNEENLTGYRSSPRCPPVWLRRCEFTGSIQAVYRQDTCPRCLFTARELPVYRSFTRNALIPLVCPPRPRTGKFRPHRPKRSTSIRLQKISVMRPHELQSEIQDVQDGQKDQARQECYPHGCLVYVWKTDSGSR